MNGRGPTSTLLLGALLWLPATSTFADSPAPSPNAPPPSAAAPHGHAKASKPDPKLAATPADAGAAQPTAANEPAAEASLPEGHKPTLQLKVEPQGSVRTGELVHVEISAVAPVGDDVTVVEQSFAPFEVYKKAARVEPPQGDKQRFVFQLDLLALEPGDKPLPAIALRVVTKDNFVGAVKTDPTAYKVRALTANEPNAQPKLETKPVAVLEDNYVPIYILGGLLAAAAIAGLTLLISRYLRKRRAAAVPPPPPRPPWEIAVEKLAELRRKKSDMLAAGQGGLFVDQLSDAVRAYLGGRYLFEGLETTTDEMLMQLRVHGATLGLTQEVGQFLGRCDLVKFAKVEPDEDEVDLLFAKAQDLVHLSEPNPVPPSAATTTPSKTPPTARSPRPGPGDQP